MDVASTITCSLGRYLQAIKVPPIGGLLMLEDLHNVGIRKGICILFLGYTSSVAEAELIGLSSCKADLIATRM